MTDLLREIRWEQTERFIACDDRFCLGVLRYGDFTADMTDTMIFIGGLGYV